MNKMKIRLYWADFYDLMDSLGVHSNYNRMEEMLIEAFKEKFKVKHISIEWMD